MLQINQDSRDKWPVSSCKIRCQSSVTNAVCEMLGEAQPWLREMFVSTQMCVDQIAWLNHINGKFIAIIFLLLSICFHKKSMGTFV